MAEPYLNETNTSTELQHEVGRLNKRFDFIADKLEKAKITDIIEKYWNFYCSRFTRLDTQSVRQPTDDWGLH